MSCKIVLTGGGSAGHVTPNIALIDTLQEDGWQIDYIGSALGIEKKLIAERKIRYHAISTGKLRRYFSWQNFIDPFKVIVGMIQAFFLIRKIRPDVVFSKGGFVAFPVVFAAWLNRIPVVAHESDLTPGLANRLSFPFVTKICVTFATAKNNFKNKSKIEVTGTPIRQQLLKGDKAKGLAFCGFTQEKPCLLIIGGGQGAASLNVIIRQSIDKLCERFQVIHLCGKGKVDPTFANQPGYCQFEYVDAELADLFAAADIVISRAGANALYEILVLAKPHILVPLAKHASRGDQVQNAHYFQKQGVSVVVNSDALTPAILFDAIDNVINHRAEILQKLNALSIESATSKIVEILQKELRLRNKSC